MSTQGNTAKASPVFSPKVFHGIKQGLLRNKKMMIVSAVLYFVGLPLNMLILIMSLLLDIQPDIGIYSAIGALTTGAALLCGSVAAVLSMPYLYKKTETDMHFSLPVTTTQRYISDFFSGLLTYTLPYIASTALGLLLTLAASGLHRSMLPTAVPGSTALELGETFFTDIIPPILKAAVAALFIMLLYYAISILVMTFCGAMLENVFNIVLVNCIIPGFIAMVTHIVTENIYGLSFDDMVYKLLPFTSPLGAVIYFFDELVETGSAGEMVIWLIKVLAAACVYAVLAYLVYRKRRAEDTGKPVVYEFFYTIIMLLLISCLCFLFMSFDDTEMLIPMVIVTAIFYFVFTVIKNRGFKKLGRAAALYAAIVVVSFGSFRVIEATEAFGAGKYVPSPDSVRSVEINYIGFGREGMDLTSGENGIVTSKYSSYAASPVLYDKANIEAVTRFHKAILDSRKEDIRAQTGYPVTLTYKTTLGRSITRNYPDVPADLFDILLPVDVTEEMRTARGNAYAALISRLKPGRKTAQQQELENCITLIGEYGQFSPDANTYIKDLPEGFEDDLAEAVKADVMAEPEEAYYGTQRHRTAFIAVWLNYYTQNPYMIPINESYTNTVACLEKYGFEELSLFGFQDQSKTAALSPNDLFLNNVWMYSVKMYEKAAGKDVINGSNVVGYTDDSQNMSTDSDILLGVNLNLFLSHYDITDLLEYSRPDYAADDVDYYICLNGRSYGVLPKYSKVAGEKYVGCYVGGIFSGKYARTPYEIKKFLDVYAEDVDLVYGSGVADGLQNQQYEDIYH